MLRTSRAQLYHRVHEGCIKPVRRHHRFAVVRTEDNVEIDSGENLQHGHDP
jgi:hypothetical protein